MNRQPTPRHAASRERAPLRILWIATKPPCPPTDGGRLVQLLTLQALAEEGHELTVMAPAHGTMGTADAARDLPEGVKLSLLEARVAGVGRAAMRAFLGGQPLTIARHALRPVHRRLASLLAERRFDVAHLEQLQALASAERAVGSALPMVLRCQNVESQLWLRISAIRRGLSARLLCGEARRLAAWEGAAVGRVSACVALTETDAGLLRQLSPEARVDCIPAPFPPELPARQEALAGDPALVILDGGSWEPSRDGVRWFLDEVWPQVSAALPGARLHHFGAWGVATRPGIVHHAAPSDSREAFAESAVFVVPLRVGSGVRMKILEAWSRGVPVVATPQAAEGLEAEDGCQLLLARDGREHAAALGHLSTREELRRRLVAEGRRHLRRHHDPSRVARQLTETYLRAGASASGCGRASR